MKEPSKKKPLKAGLPKRAPPNLYKKSIKPVKKDRYSEIFGLAVKILLGIIIYSKFSGCESLGEYLSITSCGDVHFCT